MQWSDYTYLQSLLPIQQQFSKSPSWKVTIICHESEIQLCNKVKWGASIQAHTIVNDPMLVKVRQKAMTQLPSFLLFVKLLLKTILIFKESRWKTTLSCNEAGHIAAA